MHVILDDINISMSPAKKTPVLASASDITRQANNPINVRQQKNSPISAKNFIPNIIILNIPFMNLYSLCLGSQIIILFSFCLNRILLFSFELFDSLLSFSFGLLSSFNPSVF